ncbi:MAG: L,D-transpeptidase family protein [Parasphingopyxis sp.]|nr:L,D-transpeptidase family protein [Sphingomonadales bacterium]
MRHTNGLWLGTKLVIAAAIIGLMAQFGSISADMLDQAGVEPEPQTLATAAPTPQPVEAPAQTLLSLASTAHGTAANGGFQIVSELAVTGPMEHGTFAWNDSGVPDGELRIIIDLDTEMLHVYRAGYEIGRAVILYGADEKPTPTGRFTITEKNIDHVSNLYDAPMPYMMRLTNDGIAIHGSEVDYGYATHGCIGVPDDFAALLFEQAQLGTRVLIRSEGSARTI